MQKKTFSALFFYSISSIARHANMGKQAAAAAAASDERATLWRFPIFVNGAKRKYSLRLTKFK
jgi:hypothetical protein